MRRNAGILAAAMALAGLSGVGQVASGQINAATSVQYQATAPKSRGERRTSPFQYAGGLGLFPSYGNFGLTPKEYGLRFGNGRSRKGKTNYQRLAHNAKLSRRMA